MAPDDLASPFTEFHRRGPLLRNLDNAKVRAERLRGRLYHTDGGLVADFWTDPESTPTTSRSEHRFNQLFPGLAQAARGYAGSA